MKEKTRDALKSALFEPVETLEPFRSPEMN